MVTTDNTDKNYVGDQTQLQREGKGAMVSCQMGIKSLRSL